MRVLVFHGYLLRGTGSNVYNARLCAALARAGHSVDLLCQEPRPGELDFVDAVGAWEDGVAGVETLREPVQVTVWRPDIGRLLPVYVADRYEGFEARTLLECRDAEVEAYVDANVKIGAGTRIWHFSHILGNTVIGERCSLGQNVVVGHSVTSPRLAHFVAALMDFPRAAVCRD